MWTTYAALLQELKQAQAAPYRSDPERIEAIFQTMQEIMQTILEKLSRAADESPGQPEPVKRDAPIHLFEGQCMVCGGQHGGLACPHMTPMAAQNRPLCSYHSGVGGPCTCSDC